MPSSSMDMSGEPWLLSRFTTTSVGYGNSLVHQTTDPDHSSKNLGRDRRPPGDEEDCDPNKAGIADGSSTGVAGRRDGRNEK